MERRTAFLLACVLLSAVPHATARSLEPPASPGEGELHVYLDPLPPEANRITFSVDAIAAVPEQGEVVPIALKLSSVTSANSRWQRLLGVGRLPAGSYAGLSLKIGRASLGHSASQAALLVPDQPVRVDAPFVVARGRAVVVWAAFRYESALDGVQFTPSFSAAVAPLPIAGRAGFVSNSGSNSVTVFDKRLQQAAAVIRTCQGPAGMALDQRAARLYVACDRDDEILAIDVASAEVVERARLLPGDAPREVALTPDGRTLVATSPDTNSVTFLDTAPLTRLERVAVGSGPGSVLVEPSGRRAFVFNTQSSSISIVDIARRAVVGTISTEPAPLRGQFTARGERLVVIHERSPYVSVVDPFRSSVVRRARLTSDLDTIRVDTRRNLAYVGGRRDARIEFYELNTLLPVDSMRLGSGAIHIAIDGGANRLYVVSPDVGRLVVGSLADRTVVSEIDVGGQPAWVVVMGER